MMVAERCPVVVFSVALALACPVEAQPAACAACSRGDAVIHRFSLEPIRSLAGDLARTRLDDPVTSQQYAHLIALRQTAPALTRLGAIDDPDLDAIASALCQAATGPCVDTTAHALRCLADRCAVDLGRATGPVVDVATLPKSCRQYSTHLRSPWFGVGTDFGTGWQRSRYPSDGGVWSLGIEARARLTSMFGAVARVDRTAGRDEATDANHDGRDDFSTGSITRITTLAGPSLIIDHTRFGETIRSLRLDLLGGYMSTRSQADESGPAAGFDLAYQLWAVRFGFRLVQGFGDANEATMLLAHLGVLTGTEPPFDDDRDCGAEIASRSSALALGLDLPLVGYGLSSQLGYLVPGLGVEAAWHLRPAIDALTHADLLVYPEYHRDRVLQQALLAGVRIDHGHRPSGAGWFTTVMAGYSHTIGVTPTSVGSGPVADVSLALGGQGKEAAVYVRLHVRFGIGPDNFDNRTVFLSGGFEMRLDPRRWRDRD
jgi:hypothetical protein